MFKILLNITIKQIKLDLKRVIVKIIILHNVDGNQKRYNIMYICLYILSPYCFSETDVCYTITKHITRK